MKPDPFVAFSSAPTGVSPRPLGRGGAPVGVGANFPVVSFATPLVHVYKDVCDCPKCAEKRVALIRGKFLGVPRSARDVRQGNLLERLERPRGLSNPAYRAAMSGTANLELIVTPSRSRFRLSDPISDVLTPQRMPTAPRGKISELSDGARSRLADRAVSLTEEGYTPDVMITLTSPANWEALYVATVDGESICGGRVFKEHLKAFRKRLERFFARHSLGKLSALWFLEFQKRGAPHVHLILFGATLPEPVRRSLRNWAGRAWSSIVGNPDAFELGKHRRAGTQVARMRAKHFGYAVKYATKTEQKTVPDEFEDVGRFWGVWNYDTPAPVVLSLDFNRLDAEEAALVRRIVGAALETVTGYSAAFVARQKAVLERCLRDGLKCKIGFSVFGKASGEAAKDAISA